MREDLPALAKKLRTRAPWEAKARLRVADADQWPIDGTPPRSLKERWDRIEAERRELRGSGRVIDYLDFGAGKPGEDRRDEPVLQQVSITDTLDNGNLALPFRQFLSRLAYDNGSRRILELGTSLGVSSAYMAAGATAAADGDEIEVRTLDGAPALVAEAEGFWQRTGYSDVCNAIVGPFGETLTSALEDYDNIDLVFIDGHHDGVATVSYFETIRQKCSQNALIVFDDISNYSSMRQAWRLVSQHHSVAEVLDLRIIGAVRLGDQAMPGVAYKRLD